MHKVSEILSDIARENQISVTKVRRQIQELIDAGMQNDDPGIQAAWGQVERKGEKPTPEELLIYLAQSVSEKLWRP